MQIGLVRPGQMGGNTVHRIRPTLDVLAPSAGSARMSGPGSGHFVKMVRNGIEYGLIPVKGVPSQ